jgi:pyruvate,water dikinase
VRRHKGRVYFNLSLSAQLQADHAAVEPMPLQLNGQHYSLAKWEKPGFLAAFKFGRGQKRIDDSLNDYARQIATITETARAWYLKTQMIQRWGQAEVLQIMEEIERVGLESMAAFLAARTQLGQHYARLFAEVAANTGANQASLGINDAITRVPGLIETAMLDALTPIAKSLNEPSTLHWLRAGNFADWRTELPNEAATEQIKAFVDAYGHRALHEGEMAGPRWKEDATPIFAALLAQAEASASTPQNAPASNPAALLEKVPAAARKQTEQSIDKIIEGHKLQSSALHALAYIWAGTRTWALAAAREAMVDKRLEATGEVFHFELEEIKQMMTGEWNISSRDEIRALLAQRQAEQIAIQQEIAPDILVGDQEAFATQSGLAGVAGKASGPLHHLETTTQTGEQGAIFATRSLDSGCVLALPVGAAFVAEAGTPCDPFVIAAHQWQRPVVVAFGKSYQQLADGAATVVDARQDAVTVTQG